MGSSPHSRGTLYNRNAANVAKGIIPAFAGNTVLAVDQFCNIKDHPRIRGEHSSHSETSGQSPGSSPHSRGTLRFDPTIHPLPGIIPAFAGNTYNGGNKNVRNRDHPRIRGEHCIQHFLRSCPAGSSPHSRGTRPATAYGQHLARIIPAFAGNT